MKAKVSVYFDGVNVEFAVEAATLPELVTQIKAVNAEAERLRQEEQMKFAQRDLVNSAQRLADTVRPVGPFGR